jgi:hypothetical protein
MPPRTRRRSGNAALVPQGTNENRDPKKNTTLTHTAPGVATGTGQARKSSIIFFKRFGIYLTGISRK